MSFLARLWQQLDGWAAALAEWLPHLVAGLVVFAAFWLAAVLAARLLGRLLGRGPLAGNPVARLLARLTRATLLVLGVVTALGTLGMDVSALVAGLGLTGFAVGFALKDAISNMLAGVLVLLYKPFELDDRISVAGFEGRVLAIDLRYTTLEGEARRVYVPNAVLFSSPVQVLERGP